MRLFRKHVQIRHGMRIQSIKQGTVVLIKPSANQVLLFFKNRDTGIEHIIPFYLDELRKTDGRNLRFEPPFLHPYFFELLLAMAVAVATCMHLKFYVAAAVAILVPVFLQYFHSKEYTLWFKQNPTFEE